MITTAIQAVGIVFFLAGLFVLTGLGWTLLAAGVVTTAIATAYEIQEVKNARKPVQS